MRDTESVHQKRSDRRETTTEDDDSDKLNATSETAGDRWLTETPVLDADLPDDVATLLGRLLGDDPVETLGGWITEVRQHTGGSSITVDELCHADVETPHWGEVDGEIYHFRCFYDAVILAVLIDELVDVRTESPKGAVIEVYAAGTDDLRVTPEEAVFSFGIDETVDPPNDGEPSTSTVYSAVCPYVRAFPDAATYEKWAGRVLAATVAMPFSDATDVAAALIE